MKNKTIAIPPTKNTLKNDGMKTVRRVIFYGNGSNLIFEWDKDVDITLSDDGALIVSGAVSLDGKLAVSLSREMPNTHTIAQIEGSDKRDQLMGAFIRSLRVSKGWTLSHLAGEIPLTKQAVSRWESGDNSPSLDSLNAVATAFGMTYLDFLLRYYDFAQNELEKTAILASQH